MGSQWQGVELTWATKAEIKKALKEKDLSIETPLKGCHGRDLKKFKIHGWKVLLHTTDQSQFIIYKQNRRKDNGNKKG